MATSYLERMAQAKDRIPKLPKWAQDYIETIERKERAARRELDEIKNPPGDSNVFVVRGLRPDDQAIGKDVHVRFAIRQGNRDDSIDVRADRREPGLIVMGDDMITVEPYSGNSVRIRFREEVQDGAH